MCGICALSRAPQSSIPDGAKFIRAGLVAIETRGFDSTGVAWTRGKAEVVWHQRLVGPAHEVAHQLDLDNTYRIHSALLHTRWASQGAVNWDNAHPVVHEHIVLVHNGVLDNDEELIGMAGVERPVGCEVDSFALPALLSKQHEMGADHPTELLELVEGDAAIAWYNANDPSTLHLARLTGRPMTIGSTKRGDFIMSSTPQTLKRTATLSRVAIEDFTTVKEGTYLAVRKGRIVEWSRFKPRRRPKPVAPPLPLVRETKGQARRRRKANRRQPIVHGPMHGITDRVEAGDDWWQGEGYGPGRYDWDDVDTADEIPVQPMLLDRIDPILLSDALEAFGREPFGD